MNEFGYSGGQVAGLMCAQVWLRRLARDVVRVFGGAEPEFSQGAGSWCFWRWPRWRSRFAPTTAMQMKNAFLLLGVPPFDKTKPVR